MHMWLLDSIFEEHKQTTTDQSAAAGAAGTATAATGSSGTGAAAVQDPLSQATAAVQVEAESLVFFDTPSEPLPEAKPARSTVDDGAFLILGNSAPAVDTVQPLPPTAPIEIVSPLVASDTKSAAPAPTSPFDVLSVAEAVSPATPTVAPAVAPAPAAAPASSPFFDMLSNSEPVVQSAPTLAEPVMPTQQDASVSFFDEISAPAQDAPVELTSESEPVMFFDEPVAAIAEKPAEKPVETPAASAPIAVTMVEEKSTAPSMPDLFASAATDSVSEGAHLEKSLEKKDELRDTAPAKKHAALPSFFDEPMVDATTPAKTQSVPELCMNVAVNLDGILDHALEECDQLLGAKVQERTEKEELIARLNKEIADLKKRSKNVLDDVKSVDLEITKIKATRQVFADQKKQAEKTKK